MLNVIALVGRLTRDPELRKTNSGTNVAAFTIACDNPRKNANGEKDTLFMDCEVYGPQADTVTRFFSKGSGIAVHGRLCSRKYVNKQGVTVTAYGVKCDNVEFNDLATKGESKPDASLNPFEDDDPMQSNGSLDEPEEAPKPKFDPMTGKPLTNGTKRK